jgi:anthranilate phosphoribosyltransferase
LAINQATLNLLRKQQTLTESAAYDVAIEFLNGNCTTPEILEVLQLLQKKGESVSEIVGFIKAMRANMTPLVFSQKPLIDICGTGGSLPNRFNVSTCVALTLGVLGYHVAKHGNRGSKKPNGSFDFLDEIGIPYDLSESEHQARLNQYGATFLFARLYHPAVRHVADARKQLSARSIFNLIGPFCNPASPNIQIIGTPSNDLAKTLIQVGKSLNYKTFAVITSDIGLDECSSVGDSTIYKLSNGIESKIGITPELLGINHTLKDISVSPNALASDNATEFKLILQHQDRNHPLLTLIALNTAVIMHIIDEKVPIEDGLERAKSAILSLSI